MKKLSLLLAVAGLSLVSPSAALAGHLSTNKALHLHDDVVRDGRADIVFRGGTALAYWTISGSDTAPVISSAYAGNAGPGYTVVAVSDFDGEGSADVLWTNGSHLKMWINDGLGGYTPVSVGNYGGGWEAFAAGDINGDGKSDLFFRGSTHLAYWLMDGPRVTASSYAGDGGAGYRVITIDDFLGASYLGHVEMDHSVGVLWSNGVDMKVWTVWRGNGRYEFVPFTYSLPGSFGNGWEPFATGDVNGDGTTDILFRNGSHLAYWQVQFIDDQYPFWFFISEYLGDGGAEFRPVAVSDYDGDKSADVLWTNGTQMKLWRRFTSTSSMRYKPTILGGYGGGWEPLEMLISAK